MLAEMKPGIFVITASVASTSRATSCCWRSGSTVKTLISVITSFSTEIVVSVIGRC